MSDERVNFEKMWGKFSAAKDVSSLKKIKLLAEGPSGSGKTSFVSRWRRPLVGVTELQAIPVIEAENPNAIIFANSDGRPGIRDGRDLQQFRAMLHDPNLAERVDAVVLDGLTDAQLIIKETYGAAQEGAGRDEIQLQTWNAIGNMTVRLCRELRDLPVHVAVTVLDQEVEDNGRIVHRPDMLMKKIPNKVMQFFNCVAFCHSRRTSSGDTRFEAMFRSSGSKYRVKALRKIDDAEPPEPLWLAHKSFGEDLPDDVRHRVDAWREMDKSEDGDDLLEKPKRKNKKKGEGISFD